MGKIVTIRQGKLRGENCEGYCVFKGIPYAEAPTGPLRWKRPQPHRGWEGIREATAFGAPCIQPGSLPDTFYGREFYQDTAWQRDMSEDCLFLNVWVPEAPAPEEGYPVACWIHGGAFLNGFSHEIEFDGAGFCRRGVILVTLNYRLNVFGFFDHPWLEQEDEDGMCGNYGLYDQAAALEWVRDNIAAFGGNSKRITIFGQSAGARSVQIQCESPMTKGLFSQAILQSGAGLEKGLRQLRREESIENGRKVVQSMGIDSLEALRAMPGRELMAAWLEISHSPEHAGCTPHWDGRLIGEGAREPEGEMGAVPIHPHAVMAGAMQDEFKNLFPGTSPLSGMWVNTTKWAREVCVARDIPCYLYHFERKLPGDDAGAFHSGELWYVFETQARSWRPFEALDAELSRLLASYWTNFIQTGDPNGAGHPTWTPYKPADDDEARTSGEGPVNGEALSPLPEEGMRFKQAPGMGRMN